MTWPESFFLKQYLPQFKGKKKTQNCHPCDQEIMRFLFEKPVLRSVPFQGSTLYDLNMSK